MGHGFETESQDAGDSCDFRYLMLVIFAQISNR